MPQLSFEVQLILLRVKYASITIIYNPKSTGPSYKFAKRLRVKLRKFAPTLSISLLATHYAGHAEELAYEVAHASKNPLIISSSGDGGYNEVINGALRAQQEGVSPICAVLAAGNANDHSRTLTQKTLFDAIKNNRITSIDVLKLSYKTAAKTEVRYAHSYIGLGLSPVVAVELNKTNLNAFKELWIILNTFYKYRPFKIKRGSKTVELDSMIFMNIGEMAKVLTLAADAKPDDGLFEVILFPHADKLKLIKKIAKATITGLEAPKQYKTYTFKVLKDMPIQLDGEVLSLPKNTEVTITAEHKMLHTVL